MSKRQQELKHNELADWLENKIEDARPYFPMIGLGIVVLIGLIIGGWWYSGQRTHAAATAWNNYFTAIAEPNQQEALEAVIKDGSGTPASLWAQQSLADMNLSRGAPMMFSDREQAQKMLETAEKNYNAVLKKATEPILVNRANFGLARTLESLCQPEKALKLYEKVAQNENGSAIGKAAAAAAERLKDPRDQELLAWFAEQKPTRPVPTPGPGGGLPPLPNDLPDRPDLGLPGIDLGGSTAPQPGPGGLSFPVPVTGAKTDEKTEEKSADKPDEKSDEKPAEPSAEKSDEKPDAPAEKAAEKSAEKSDEKGPDKADAPSSDTPPESSEPEGSK